MALTSVKAGATSPFLSARTATAPRRATMRAGAERSWETWARIELCIVSARRSGLWRAKIDMVGVNANVNLFVDAVARLDRPRSRHDQSTADLFFVWGNLSKYNESQ